MLRDHALILSALWVLYCLELEVQGFLLDAQLLKGKLAALLPFDHAVDEDGLILMRVTKVVELVHLSVCV